MKSITKKAHEAFMKRKAFNESNTEVKITDGLPSLYLFGNKIAEMESDGDIFISSCGWFSNTTRERLNAFIKIRLTKGQFIINEKFAWDGKRLNISKL